MYAVIKTGGKQFKVQQGDLLRVEKLPGDVGQAVKFDEVLLVGDDAGTQIGKPLVPGASVEATIQKHGRARKVVIFKMRRRKTYRRKRGHRQWLTEVRITGIRMGAGAVAPKRAPRAEPPPLPPVVD